MKIRLVIGMQIDHDGNDWRSVSFAMKMIKLIFGNELLSFYPVL